MYLLWVTQNITFILQLGFYIMSLKKLVLSFWNQDSNSTYSKCHCHHKCYVEYSTCKYKTKWYCMNQNKFCLHYVIKITVAWLQNILKITRILFMSTIHTRWAIRYINISFILWLMHNYLTAQNRLKYRQCQPWLSTTMAVNNHGCQQPWLSTTAILAHDHR